MPNLAYVVMPDLAYVVMPDHFVMPDLIGHLLRHCRPDRQSINPSLPAPIGNLLRTGREWGRRDTKS